MDEQRFDDMVRTLGERGSRRGALRTLAGALAALASAAAAGTLAKSKKKKKGSCAKKPCPGGQQRNKRTCKCECARTPCSGGMEFDVKQCRCRCPRDMRECRDGCVGRDECCPSDPLCPEDPKGCCHSPGVEVCTIDGCCAELDGIKVCNDFCIDTNTHFNHCGDCNVSCGAGKLCLRGSCEPLECANGKPACGTQCCDEGELCCNGECRPGGTAICTKDGWCPAIDGSHACCGTGGCAEGSCCDLSANEVCCAWIESNGDVGTTCCPADGDRCAPGGCCPAGMTFGDCGACCPIGNRFCEGCVAPAPGRG